MTLDDYQEVYREHHGECEAIAAILSGAGPEEARRADRMKACATYIEGYQCPDCGEFHVTRTRLCRDRLCPNCGWLLAKQRYHAAEDALERINEVAPLQVNHMVLTVQHDKDSDLKELVRTLTRGYGKLMRSDTMSDSVLGSTRGVEITHGEDNGFHPHVHAIVAEPRDRALLSQEQVRDAWRDILSADYDPQVSFAPAYTDDATRADGGETWAEVCMEAVKYAIKPGFLPRLDADNMLKLTEAIKGSRLRSSDGIVKDALAMGKLAKQNARHGGPCVCGTVERAEPVTMCWDYQSHAMRPCSRIPEGMPFADGR